MGLPATPRLRCDGSARYPKIPNRANHALDTTMVGAAAARERADGLLEEGHAEDPAGNLIRGVRLAFLKALKTS